LIDIKRLDNIPNIKMYHLHVDYDEENNIIKYDRELREGSGDNFYGLNVAKYLISDDKFMNLASIIKKELFELPDLINDKTSNYNKNLYMDICQICNHQPKKNEIPLETHHIVFQKDFSNGINSDKYHLKKNHKSNLVVLCHKCHDKIDKNEIIVNGWLDTNINNKLDYYINTKSNSRPLYVYN
jgi:DNA mismatch repair protein MutS